MKTRPCASGSGSGGSTISLAGGSFSMATNGDGPRISFAPCPDATVANKEQAAIAPTNERTACMIIPFKNDLVRKNTRRKEERLAPGAHRPSLQGLPLNAFRRDRSSQLIKYRRKERP